MKNYKLLLSFLLFGCAGLLNGIPEREVYRYSDLYNHHYILTLRKGVIIDTSWVLDSSGKEIEVLARKHHEKNVISIDTVFGKSNIEKPADSCHPRDGVICQRSTESILNVIRKGTPNLRKTYNKYLYGSSFGGKVTLKFKIDPEGNIRYLYLEGNTTGVHDFALEILEEINKWKFEKIDNQSFDVVTVPFTFSR